MSKWKLLSQGLRHRLAAALMLCLLPPATTAACLYTISSEWNSGYVATIAITNPGSTTLNGWNVSWQYASNRLASSWNASISGSNPYSASPVGWNASIPPGGRVEFGFVADKNGGAAEVPSVSGAACAGGGDPLPPVDVPHLYQLAAFPVGVAVSAGNEAHSILRNDARAAAERAALERHFNSLTPGNIMKMSYLHPAENTYTFEQADALVAYAHSHGVAVHGHALVWHSSYQVPAWMTGYSGNWPAMLQSHVQTIVAHYANQVISWDVVNEAFADDGDTSAVNGYRNSVFLQKLGPAYIEQAFIAARAGDPHADLYYNDYNIEGGQQKFERVLAMADDFKARGIPLDGIGLQMHINIEWPSAAQLRSDFGRIVQRGLKVRLSELDMPVNTYANPNRYASFTAEAAQRQKDKYREVVAAYLEVVPPALRGGITVWGLYDSDSWLIDLYGRPDWPLLLNDALEAKPALQGVADGLTGR